MNDDDVRKSDRYEKGVIQKEIIKYVLNFPDGIIEPHIRVHLEEDFGLTAQKGIKIHLEKIRAAGYLLKQERRGSSNIWIINYENSNNIAAFIAREFLIPIFFSLESRNDVLDIFYLPGTQTVLSNFELYEVFYFTLFYRIIEIWKGKITHPISITPNENIELRSEKIDKLIRRSVQFSPTLFCSLFGGVDIINLSFWLTFDESRILKGTHAELLEILTSHYILTALMVDWDHFDLGAGVINFLKINRDLVDYHFAESVFERMIHAEDLHNKTREFVEILLVPPE